MEKTKLTKKEKFGMILAIEEVAQNEMLVDFINHELELLNKKASKSGATKGQKENAGYKDVIVEISKKTGMSQKDNLYGCESNQQLPSKE